MSRKQASQSQAEDAVSDYGTAMRVSEVARELGVSPATVYRLADRGDLKRMEIQLTGTNPTIRIEKTSVIKLLSAWLDGQ